MSFVPNVFDLIAFINYTLIAEYEGMSVCLGILDMVKIALVRSMLWHVSR